MDIHEQQHFDLLYEQHLTNLTLQGKRPAIIDAYSRAIRRIATYFNWCPYTLTTDDLKRYFVDLIASHSWNTVELDRNGSKFFYFHVLNKSWQWLNIVKPPQTEPHICPMVLDQNIMYFVALSLSVYNVSY